MNIRTSGKLFLHSISKFWTNEVKHSAINISKSRAPIEQDKSSSTMQQQKTKINNLKFVHHSTQRRNLATISVGTKQQ
jgi:hypothetical protein